MDNGDVSLKTAEASITTCTVTIKAIKINNRQVTQAIFTQLPREPLFDDDDPETADTANIWGWVNWKPKGEQADGTQFVVQKNGRLVRCPFWVRRITRNSGEWPWPVTFAWRQSTQDAAIYILAMALEGTLIYHEEPGTYGTKEQRYWVDLGPTFGRQRFSPGESSSSREVGTGWAVKHALKPHPRKEYVRGATAYTEVEISADEVRERSRCTLREEIVKLTKEAQGCPEASPAIFTAAFWRKRIDNRAREVAGYVKCWNEIIDKLDAVVQLYIAT